MTLEICYPSQKDEKTENNGQIRSRTRKIFYKSPLSRPCTASSIRSSSSSGLKKEGKITVCSRPTTSSTVRTASLSRAEVNRVGHVHSPYLSVDNVVKPTRSKTQKGLFVSRCPRSESRRPSAVGNSGASVENAPPSGVSICTEKQSWTSKDMLLKLFEAWQPQLCSSYRRSVEYIPTSPLQMKTLFNAMLLDKPPSPYLERFRTVGRVVESLSRLNSYRENCDGGEHAAQDSPHLNECSTVGSSDQHLQPISPECESPIPSYGKARSRHLPTIRTSQRPKSSLHTQTRSASVQLTSGQDLARHAKLKKTNSQAVLKSSET